MRLKIPNSELTKTTHAVAAVKFICKQKPVRAKASVLSEYFLNYGCGRDYFKIGIDGQFYYGNIILLPSTKY